MCNAYNVRTSGKQIGQIVNEEINRLPGRLIRRRGPGVVLLSGRDGLRAETMRWGFDHPAYKEVNNARSDSLPRKRGIWRAPQDEGRRCLVPIASFYEWGERVQSPKPVYEFSRPDGDSLRQRHQGPSHKIPVDPSPVASQRISDSRSSTRRNIPSR